MPPDFRRIPPWDFISVCRERPQKTEMFHDFPNNKHQHLHNFHQFPSISHDATGEKVPLNKLSPMTWSKSRECPTPPGGNPMEESKSMAIIYITHRIHGAGIYIYMLTWLGYIDGIHVTIYSIHGSYGLWISGLWPYLDWVEISQSITGWWCNFTILKNIWVRQWVSDDIPYMKWTITHVWNHQPVINPYWGSPLQNISQWEGLSHILWTFMDNKTCLKPPTR